MNTIENVSRSVKKLYKSMSFWYKIVLFTCILLLLVMIYNRHHTPITREGFQQKDTFIMKSGGDIYDNFYVGIYDDLTYDSFKNNYEVGEIMMATKLPPQTTLVLDIGSGTGHHCKLFSKQGYKTYGLDKSSAMITSAKKKYPKIDFRQGDALTAITFPAQFFFTYQLSIFYHLLYTRQTHLFAKLLQLAKTARIFSSAFSKS